MPGFAISHTLATIAILVTLATPGHAASVKTQLELISVRSGSHADFGRLVIDVTATTGYQMDQDGDHLVLRFTGDAALGSPPRLPRNVAAMKIDGATIDLVLTHGARVHPMRMDGHVVLDIQDAVDKPGLPVKNRQQDGRAEHRLHPPLAMASSPELGGRSAIRTAVPEVSVATERPPVQVQPLPPPPATQADQPAVGQPPATLLPSGTPAATPPPSVQPATGQPQPAQAGPGPSPAGPPAPVADAASPAVVEAVQQTPPGRDVLPGKEGPVDLLARRVKLPKGMDGSAFLVPFDSTTGAAAFRRGDSTYVVFDERRPVDMSAIRADPLFGAATVQLLPSGTLLRVPLPPARSIALTQMPQGWRIAALTTVPKQQPILAAYVDGRLSLAAEQSSDVVNLADPDTGATLLVGTQHRSGQALATSRRGAEFILRPTIQGVVVEPLSDGIALKRVPTGFILAGGVAGLALSPPTSATDSLMDAALLTKRLDFSNLPADALLRRTNKQFADAAALPPLVQGSRHHLAAQSLIALGLGAEAEGLLHLAAEQDPKEAASADTGALTAIAALLAGRVEDADALMDPRLDGTDEIALWRAIRQAMQDEGSPSAAAVFSATAPLAFQYPAPIREHILPLMVETMIQGGEIAPAAHLLDQRKNDPKLAYARALMRQAEGDTGQALTMLDALANGHDQFDRARAAVRAVEIRLATRKLDKTQAADALDKLLYAWRGDARELALRERVADLRQQTGAWRPALAILRQAEADFPEQAKPIDQRLKDVFAGMVRDHSEQQAPPIEFVATVDENTDLVTDSSSDDAVRQALADRLLALDLPDRAKPVLEKLMRSAKSDVAKAQFGVSLATLQSRDGDDAGTRATLDSSEGQGLPAALVEQRMVLRAGSVARMGNPTGAAAMLAPLHTARAAEARAQILENAADWSGAQRAWTDCVALTLPDSGMLDENQTRTMLRLATATARAGDDSGLATLRANYAARIGAGPVADVFRLLTAEPIRTTSDIKRSQQEMNLAASLPTDLKALHANATSR